ncbi:MAG: hypothetical protein IIU46_07750 [Treponema sp.]|nr:hypothetical protein [Treponema sp.]
MKKILTLAAVGLVAASSLNAQPTVKASFTMRSNVASTDFDKWTFLDLDGYGNLANALLFSASTKNVGIELEIDPVISFVDTSGTGQWLKSLSLEKYNAWVTFGRNHEFTIRAGSWDDRAVGCVNSNALAFSGIDFEACKPGMISSINSGDLSLSTDISSQCGSSSSKKLSGMFQYKNGGLELRAAIMNLNFASNDGFVVTDKFNFGIDTFMVEAGYSLNNVGRFLATGKFAKEEFAAAAFFEPSFPFLKNLTALAGFTAEYRNSNKTTNHADLWGWGIDLRAKYDFDRNISVTTMNNFTLNQLDVQQTAPIKNGLAMENMINILYNIHPRKNDLKVYLNVRHYTGIGVDGKFLPKLLTAAESSNADKLDWVSNFRISNDIEYNFNANAKVNAGVAFNILNCFNNQSSDNTPTFNIQVPVVFQVSF